MKGSVEHLPSGHYRARLGRKTVGTYPTEAAAWNALRGGTVGSYWPDYAVRRRQLGVRDWANDESRWELYVASDPLAQVPLGELAKRDAKAWLARMHARGLAPQTIKNALNLVRGCIADAVENEVLAVNPFLGMKLHRSKQARTHESWTILDPDEQIALLRAVAADEAHMVAFALHTGLRNSELWSLRTRDIDLETRTVTVRYSKGDTPTKGGQLRRVPLFGAGLDAAVVAVKRGHEFAWPSPRTGERRYPSSQPTRWREWLKAAGIKRHVRWYDLRHTCATSLLAGWWGRKWSVDEVRQMLGHSSIKVTERYAHLVDDTLQRAGRATHGVGPEGASYRSRTDDLRFTNSSVLERFQVVSRRVLLERYEGPHERLALEILAATDAVLSGEDATDRLAKCAELWELARDAG